MKYYLAGPMTGYPKFNFPAFVKVSELLRNAGLNIASPHEIDHGETSETRGQLSYGTYMRAALKVMLDCDGLIALPGWKQSKGAHMEVTLARMCGMDLYWWDDERRYIFEMDKGELLHAGII